MEYSEGILNFGDDKEAELSCLRVGGGEQSEIRGKAQQYLLRGQRKVAESVWKGVYEPHKSGSDVSEMTEKMSTVTNVLRDPHPAELRNTSKMCVQL